MYLREFSIGNFKAFGPTQTLPIKPITLIYGPNSGGKSSLLHGLILAHHAQISGDFDVRYAKLGGNSVDLGGYQQYVHKRRSDTPVEMSFRFDSTGLKTRWGDAVNAGRSFNIAMSIGVRHTERKLGEDLISVDVPQLRRYEVSVDGENIMAFSGRRDYSHLGLDVLNYRHPALAEVVAKAAKEADPNGTLQISDVYGILDGLVSDIKITQGVPFPDGTELGQTEEELSHVQWTQAVERLSAVEEQAFMEMMEKSRHEPDPFAAYEALYGWCVGVWRRARAELFLLSYLGPLRDYPERDLPGRFDDPDWFAGGGFAWDAVKQDSQVRAAVNHWLEDPQRMMTPYRIEVQRSYSAGDLMDAASRSAARASDPVKHMERVLERAAATDSLRLIDLRTGTSVSHRDIGVGISQVLPVLVATLGLRGRTLLFEQPEVHIHPALQAELGDVFIQSAAERSNTFIVETHSEHLLLRVLRRIRETTQGRLPEGVTPITTKDVQVVFVEPTKSGSRVLLMEIDEEGQLVTPWPGGFFEEGFRERFGA